MDYRISNLPYSARTAILLLVVACVWEGGAMSMSAQISAEEHASHHPDKGGSGGETDSGGEMGGGGMMGGGMKGMMDGMMEKMGAPKPMDFYPTLMSLPELTPEKRVAIGQQADERVGSGIGLMGEGLDALSHAAETENHAAMQAALGTVREGLGQLDSGLAARRALAEGRAPRAVALRWFKNEMNLLPPAPSVVGHGAGGSAFHLITIAILGAFTVVMIWMYFFKMRRASALLRELASPGATAGATGATVGTVSSAAGGGKSAPAAVAEPPDFPAMRSRTEPVRRWSGKLRVCRIFDETPGVKTFRLAAVDDLALPFTYFPGQFVTLAFTIDGKQVKRSYTIASSPTQLHYCGLTIKREDQGVVSRHLHDRIKEGDLIEVSGPNGKFTFTGEEAASIVLISGGVGITPMMSVVRYLSDMGWHGDIFMLYCCRTPGDFIFREELELLQERNSNLHVTVTMTRAEGGTWKGLKGRFSAGVISHLVPDITSRRIHVCGPQTMMDGVLGQLKELGIADEHIRTEAFGPAKRPAKKSEPTGVSPPGDQPVVRFTKSGKSASLSTDQTVLAVAESVGVEIDQSCLTGQCGLCKVKLCAGQVTMESDDALSDEDKAEGLILACQAKASENLEIDA